MTQTAPTQPLQDEDFARMREYLGVDLRVEQFNEEASRDTIRHYAYGIADDNPLWLDDAYAAISRFGGRVAPPTFVYSIYDAEIVLGTPTNCQPIHVAAELEFDRPVRLGDRITAQARLRDVVDRQTAKAGRAAMQFGEIEYFNQHGERVARVIQELAILVRGSGLSYDSRPIHQYTDDELERIRLDVLAEERRGSQPRYVEDVAVGDTLTPVVKGPLDRIMMTCYYAGAIGCAAVYKGMEIRARFQEQVRNDPDSAPNTLDRWMMLDKTHPALGHQDDASAQRIGMPAPYDNGNQRTAWGAHLVTNWMGDDADLLRLRVEIRRPNVFGDTLWLRGTVTAKRDDEVDIEITGTNQLGEESTRGTATVRLPSRATRA